MTGEKIKLISTWKIHIFDPETEKSFMGWWRGKCNNVGNQRKINPYFYLVPSSALIFAVFLFYPFLRPFTLVCIKQIKWVSAFLWAWKTIKLFSFPVFLHN